MYYNQFNNIGQNLFGNTFNYDTGNDEYNFNIPSYRQNAGQPNAYMSSFGQPTDLLEQQNPYIQSTRGQLSNVFEQQPNQDMMSLMNTMISYMNMMYYMIAFMKHFYPQPKDYSASDMNNNNSGIKGIGGHAKDLAKNITPNLNAGGMAHNNSEDMQKTGDTGSMNADSMTSNNSGDMKKSGGSSGSTTGLSGSLSQIKAKGGKVILDWDNTIDTDDNNTITDDTVKWLRELAASGVETYIVSGNKGSDVMLKRLKEIDPEHKDFWENVINKNYTHAGPGKKDTAYKKITGGDYSKTVLLDDTTANIDDWKDLSKGKGLFYQPMDSEDSKAPTHATYEGVTGIMNKFANSL